MVKFLDLQAVTKLHGAEIHEAVSRVVDSGFYLQGSENAGFEADYARFIGTDYCVGCGNGLDALIWIYRAYIEMGLMQPGQYLYCLYPGHHREWSGSRVGRTTSRYP